MMQRIFLSIILGAFLSSCASTPDDGTEKEKDEPDANYCDTEVDDRNGTEVCRQY